MRYFCEINSDKDSDGKNGWDKWSDYSALLPRQWAALSVRLPADEEGFSFAVDQACGRLEDYEQGRLYHRRLEALIAAIAQGEVFGLQDHGKLSSSGFIIWCWQREYELSDDLRRVMKAPSVVEKHNLISKYESHWDTITSDFSKANSNGLAFVASLKDRGQRDGYGLWDEDAAIYWAKLARHVRPNNEENAKNNTPPPTTAWGIDMDNLKK